MSEKLMDSIAKKFLTNPLVMVGCFAVLNVIMYLTIHKFWIGGSSFLPMIGKLGDGSKFLFALIVNLGVIVGAGIFLCGGCILGTLRQMGVGNMTFLIVLISFIPGMALVVYGLNPLLQDGYNVQKAVLPDLLRVSAPWIADYTIVGLGLSAVRVNKRSHG